jgi:hypothetical protein
MGWMETMKIGILRETTETGRRVALGALIVNADPAARSMVRYYV